MLLATLFHLLPPLYPHPSGFLPPTHGIIPPNDEQVYRHPNTVPHQIHLAPLDFVPLHPYLPRWDPSERSEEEELAVEDPRGGMEEGVQEGSGGARVELEPALSVADRADAEEVEVGVEEAHEEVA